MALFKLLRFTVVGPLLLVALLGCQSRDHTAVERLEQALSRAAHYPDHNALISLNGHVLDEAARLDGQVAEQRGALWGMPLVVKDNIAVAGMPMTGGTPALRNYTPERDAKVVAQLRAAGAVVVAKSNLHELAYGITSNNYQFGAVHNAHQFDHFAGGSSGGTAVAVALGIVEAGLGTDTGGSTRIPAALNGIVGFRPTLNRYANDGLLTISSTRDTAGPMANTVTNIIRLDAVMAGVQANLEPANLKTLRLGVPRDYFYDDLEPEVADAMEHLLKRLGRAGVELVAEDIPNVDALNQSIGFPLVLYETAQLLPEFLSAALPELTTQEFISSIASPDVSTALNAAFSGAITEAVYRNALQQLRPQLQQRYANYFATHRLDAVLVPTTPLTARPIEGSDQTINWNGEDKPTFQSYIRNTDPSSNAGIPSMSLPLPVPQGAPQIGAMLDGPAGSDERLLQIGLAIEALLSQ